MNRRRRKVVVWLSALGLTFLVAWIGYTALYEGTLGQPEYTVLSADGAIEFRRYDPFIVASTHMTESGDKGLRGGFPVLAGYIFGENTPGESLAMTAPVIQQRGGGERPSAGASGLVGSHAGQMAFVMPEGRTLGDLPAPEDSAVSLHRVAWGEVAALRFSGAGKQERFQDAERQLREVLKARNRRARGPARYAQYNSPSAFPPLRRNEVIIPLAQGADRE